MTDTQGYGQHCPVAVAAEIIAERWTPLVLRSLFCGATRFNEIHASVPRMSSALLSRRLKDLEYANVIVRNPATTGRGFEYVLTASGAELFPVMREMGTWAQKWLRREITDDNHLSGDVFFWELRRSILSSNLEVKKRKVVEFHLPDAAVADRFFWLVFEPDGIDVCKKNPGFEVDLWITSSLRTLVELWLGHRQIKVATEDGSLKFDGSTGDIAGFSDWFARSPFAGVGELPAA